MRVDRGGRVLPKFAVASSNNGRPGGRGSAALGAGLADAELLSRSHLLVFLLLLGAGKRLFRDADKDATKLTLVEREVYSNGIQTQGFESPGDGGDRPAYGGCDTPPDPEETNDERAHP